VEERTPFNATLSKCMGRDNKFEVPGTATNTNTAAIKKDKSAGPGTYKIEPGELLSQQRVTAVSFSGLGTAEGGRGDLKQVDKEKVKSNRCWDQLIKAAKTKGPPGVGAYKGTETAFERIASLPRSISKKRH